MGEKLKGTALLKWLFIGVPPSPGSAMSEAIETPAQRCSSESLASSAPGDSRPLLNKYLLFIALGSLLLALNSQGATNACLLRLRQGHRMPPRTGLRTNLPALGARTNAAFLSQTRAAGSTNAASRTNALAARQNAASKAESRFGATLKRLEANRAFYPAVVGIAVCLGALFLARAFTTKKAEPSLAPSPGPKPTAKPTPKPGSTTFHSCNVLEVGAQARQVWQFEARGGGFVLNREHTALDGESLPARIVGKDWRALFQRKLNVAWLPPENVFLRVAQFPKSDFNETLAMVELQLEKLSPMPVAQVCWSFHSLPHADANQQTVIVMVVARSTLQIVSNCLCWINCKPPPLLRTAPGSTPIPPVGRIPRWWPGGMVACSKISTC